jgi:hypothetical protein
VILQRDTSALGCTINLSVLIVELPAGAEMQRREAGAGDYLQPAPARKVGKLRATFMGLKINPAASINNPADSVCSLRNICIE